MNEYLFTVHYDGIADGISDSEYDRASARYYDALDSADIVAVRERDIYRAYERALDASDHGLSISHVDVLHNGKYCNVHTLLE